MMAETENKPKSRIRRVRTAVRHPNVRRIMAELDGKTVPQQFAMPVVTAPLVYRVEFTEPEAEVK